MKSIVLDIDIGYIDIGSDQANELKIHGKDLKGKP
jgi:hypothetical protein